MRFEKILREVEELKNEFGKIQDPQIQAEKLLEIRQVLDATILDLVELGQLKEISVAEYN